MGGFGEEDSEGSEEDKEEEGQSPRNRSPRSPRRKSGFAPAMAGNLYEDLNEAVDEVDGIENDEYARLKYVPDNAESCDQSEVAVIGFWKLTTNQVFRCYHFFYVPNPMKREVKDIEGTDLQQVLYTGVAPAPEVPGDIFFFYKDDIGRLMHAILDFALQPARSHLIEHNCMTIVISASSILEHYIVDLNNKKLENEDEEEKAQDQMPNPNMIKMHDRNYVVFTAYLRESHTSSEEQPEDDVDIKIKPCTYPTVFFYDLNEGKRAWEIFGAEVFLDAVLLPGKRRYDIYYITNEIWWTEDRDEIRKQIGLDKEWSRFEEYSSYIAVLKFGNSPSAALLGDKKQIKMKSPYIATKDSYEIAFGQNKTFELTKNDKVVEAFMHNDR
jgi:hypothetical protein